MNKKIESQSKKDLERSHQLEIWIGVGISMGLIFGLLANNLPLGMSIGLVMGVAVGVSQSNMPKKKR